MTKGELYDIETRISEIEELFQSELPDDVLFNLEAELEDLITVLKDGIEFSKKSKFKVIKGGVL